MSYFLAKGIPEDPGPTEEGRGGREFPSGFHIGTVCRAGWENLFTVLGRDWGGGEVTVLSSRARILQPSA